MQPTFDGDVGLPSPWGCNAGVVLPVAGEGTQAPQQEAHSNILPMMPVVLHANTAAILLEEKHPDEQRRTQCRR